MEFYLNKNGHSEHVFHTYILLFETFQKMLTTLPANRNGQTR